MTESNLLLPPSGGAPDDSIPGTICPLRSSTALGSDRVGGAVKVSMDVPCRKSCMLYAEQAGQAKCAIAVLALAMADRA